MARSLSLYVIVFLSGASVLAVEILGTRVLGPFYGVSLFLWSALITVTLAALSVGYAVGGRMADRHPSFVRLGWLLAVAGALILLIPWLKYPILRATEPLGLRAAVLLTATGIFALPLTLLGMVSPFAIRLRTQSLQSVGTTAGNIYAVSTVASVFAALATGFILIPNMGVNRLLLLIGIALFVAAAVSFLSAGRGRGPVLAILGLAGFGAVVGFTMPHQEADPAKGLVAVEQSAYAELRVVDWEDTRLLLIDGGGHTIVEYGTWKTLYPYAVVMDLNKEFFSEPGRLLLCGLGGGSIAKSFHADGWEVEVVEIDPAITGLAREYFGLTEEEARVHHMDARQFFLGNDEPFDLIILDAFGSGSIPFHLPTTESFAEVKRSLAPGGVVAINMESIGWHSDLARAFSRTLQEHFSHVTALPLSEPPSTLGNLVILASDHELGFDEEQVLVRPVTVMQDEYLHWLAITRMHAWDNRFSHDTQGVDVITDDRNPVDLWSEQVNLEGRRVLHGSFEWKEMAW